MAAVTVRMCCAGGASSSRSQAVAAPISAVARMPGSSAIPGRNTGLRARVLITATTSGSRAQIKISWPARRMTQESAVPKAPPPITPILAILPLRGAAPLPRCWQLYGPVLGALERLMPFAHRIRRPLGIAQRLEDPVGLPMRRHLVVAAPAAHRQSGEIRGAQGGRFRDPGPRHRHADEIGLKLHQQVVARSAPIHPQLREPHS